MDSIYLSASDADADNGAAEERKEGEGNNDNFLLSRGKMIGQAMESIFTYGKILLSPIAGQ